MQRINDLRLKRSLNTASLLSICFVITCGIVLNRSLQGQSNPATVGQWTQTTAWPYAAVHTVVLRSGKVLFSPALDLGANPEIYDPASGTVTATAHAGY